MLNIQDLSVTYPDGTEALRHVSLKLSSGETCGLIGGNGAGKTTLLMALVGLVQSQGSVRVGDTELTPKTLSKLRQQVGVVFQNPDDQLFLPTVYQNVAFGLQNMGLPEQQVREWSDKTLELLGIRR